MSAAVTSQDLVTGNDQYISEQAAAKRLGLAQVTLRLWRRRGTGPRYARLGRVIRYRVSDLEAFVAARTEGGAQ